MGRDLSPEVRRAFQHDLLRWYEAHRRDLPWREDPTPYRVWISEVMLQQTRTETVLPYFERWMEAFPDAAALAHADLEDVLRVWEGLGYYARARNLHEAARLIVTQHGGRLPREEAALRALPGIGRYTAGAILSIAWGLDYPVVDGNVTRVLARVFRIEEDMRASATQRRLWTLAEALLPPGQAGTFNQALMELGNQVCAPRGPRCNECPLRPHCLAAREGLQEHLPLRRTKALETIDVAIGVLWDGERVFVQRRPPRGFLGGLWEFPGGKCRIGEEPRDCLARELREEVGYEGDIGPKLLTIHHAYTMYKVNLHVYEGRWKSGRPSPDALEWRWATLEEMRELPFPAANRRLIEVLTVRGASSLLEEPL